MLDTSPLLKSELEMPPSKADLFLELAKPDEQGFSRAVPISEFTGRYTGLLFGNGGSWARDDGGLAHRYNIRRNKDGGRIVSVELQGMKKIPIQKTINADIKKHYKGMRCVVLDTSETECDHKDGRRDDPRLNDPKKQTLDDFQPLSKAANNAKRQHCKRCRETNERYDAKPFGYPVSQVKGNGKYNGTCVGCYWHDPIEFRQLAYSSI